MVSDTAQRFARVSTVKIPPLLGLDEMASVLKLSKARVRQLAETKTFPDHFVRLHIGRVWLSAQVLQWAEKNDRPFVGEIDTTFYEQLAQALAVSVNGLPDVPNDPGYRDTLGTPNYFGTSRPVKILPEEKNSAGSVEVGEKNGNPSDATHPRRFPRSAAASDLDEPPTSGESDKPSRRSAAELNQEALAADLDDLQRIWETAKADGDLPESEIQLVGFATMVITSLANVPNYRRTKPAMVKAWAEVRKAYSATPAELVALATHVTSTAGTPWSAGAIKKFSDYEIAKIRRTSVPAKPGERAQPNRWQGAHGSHDELIAKMTPEERKLYGVDAR